jgi:hypothetical protein
MEIAIQSSKDLTASSSGEPSPTRSTSSGVTAFDPVEQIPANNNNRPSFELRLDSEDFNKPLSGWPHLATVIAKNRDFEAFQAFRDLNVKSLLYYQAELVALRKDLHDLEWKNNREDNFRNHSMLNSHADLLVLTTLKKEDDPAREQMDLVNKIRGVLKEYSMPLALSYIWFNG